MTSRRWLPATSLGAALFRCGIRKCATPRHHEPNGIRGAAPANAMWIWGLNADEYERHADVWPLNPDGDLFATMMIESVESLKNLDKIAAVPGVGALFPGAGSDLSRSMGVRQNTPELEAAFQQILKACKTHNVACAITATSGNDVAKRVKEGWKIIRSTVPAITAGRALLGEPPLSKRPQRSALGRAACGRRINFCTRQFELSAT